MTRKQWQVHGMYKCSLIVLADSAKHAVELCARNIGTAHHWIVKEWGHDKTGMPYVVATVKSRDAVFQNETP